MLRPHPSALPHAPLRSAAPDPGVLNRAEWIKYVSTFFNKEDVANRMFEATAAVSLRGSGL